jgi:hypothetical protein
VSVTDFLAQVQGPGNRSVRYWPVPACREVTLTIRKTGSDAAGFQVRQTVADPERVRLFPLPAKGALTMHPICGADLVDQPIDRIQTATDALAELAKQAEAIGKALAN